MMGSLVPDKWIIRPGFIFVNNFLTIIVKFFALNINKKPGPCKFPYGSRQIRYHICINRIFYNMRCRYSEAA